MQDFINYILDFFYQIKEYIIEFFNDAGEAPMDFFDKQIFNGSMISTPATFYDLLTFIFPIIIIFIVLWLFIKLFGRLLRIITK